ncbi:hypothetical protein [Geodermatophilus sabuli]|nr:hypothetical protein [Geodermatophilus sabuli]MBB3082260.1 hypothetical protein [Geodermatophilus sabuli]
MAESLSTTLKSELIYLRAWPTRHEMEVFSYLEGFYITRRRHSRPGNLSPTDYENVHLTRNEVSAGPGSLQWSAFPAVDTVESAKLGVRST